MIDDFNWKYKEEAHEHASKRVRFQVSVHYTLVKAQPRVRLVLYLPLDLTPCAVFSAQHK